MDLKEIIYKRKSLSEISDQEDKKLEPARLAPSSVNSQPWYFIHEDDKIHVYCVNQKLLKYLGNMNRIDMGIALTHLYTANPDTFQFFRSTPKTNLQGYYYIGSFTHR